MSKLYKFLLALISITTLNCTSQTTMALGARDHEGNGNEEELNNYVEINHQAQDPIQDPIQDQRINPDYDQKKVIEADPMDWLRHQLNKDDFDRLNNMIGILGIIQQEVVNNIHEQHNRVENLYGNNEFIENTYDLYIMMLQSLPSGHFEQEAAVNYHRTRFHLITVGKPELNRQRNRELVLIGLGRGINPNIYANHLDRSNIVTTSIKLQRRLGTLEALVDYTLENPNAVNIPDWSYINHDIGLVADIHVEQPRIHRECAEQLARLEHGSPVIWNGLSPELRRIISESL